MWWEVSGDHSIQNGMFYNNIHDGVRSASSTLFLSKVKGRKMELVGSILMCLRFGDVLYNLCECNERINGYRDVDRP